MLAEGAGGLDRVGQGAGAAGGALGLGAGARERRGLGEHVGGLLHPIGQRGESAGQFGDSLGRGKIRVAGVLGLAEVLVHLVGGGVGGLSGLGDRLSGGCFASAGVGKVVGQAMERVAGLGRASL